MRQRKKVKLPLGVLGIRTFFLKFLASNSSRTSLSHPFAVGKGSVENRNQGVLVKLFFVLVHRFGHYLLRVRLFRDLCSERVGKSERDSLGDGKK